MANMKNEAKNNNEFTELIKKSLQIENRVTQKG